MTSINRFYKSIYTDVNHRTMCVQYIRNLKINFKIVFYMINTNLRINEVSSPYE